MATSKRPAEVISEASGGKKPFSGLFIHIRKISKLFSPEKTSYVSFPAEGGKNARVGLRS